LKKTFEMRKLSLYNEKHWPYTVLQRGEKKMTQTTFSIEIPAGTKVLEVYNGKVKTLRLQVLKEIVYIDDATRDQDGGFCYQVGQTCYYASAGTLLWAAN
jgi:hypothetical protein